MNTNHMASNNMKNGIGAAGHWGNECVNSVWKCLQVKLGAQQFVCLCLISPLPSAAMPFFMLLDAMWLVFIGIQDIIRCDTCTGEKFNDPELICNIRMSNSIF